MFLFKFFLFFSIVGAWIKWWTISIPDWTWQSSRGTCLCVCCVCVFVCFCVCVFVCFCVCVFVCVFLRMCAFVFVVVQIIKCPSKSVLMPPLHLLSFVSWSPKWPGWLRVLFKLLKLLDCLILVFNVFKLSNTFTGAKRKKQDQKYKILSAGWCTKSKDLISMQIWQARWERRLQY